ncbi:MBL fold metallo-hydrolase [Micromonospora sp. STR1_7]|uniref:MBL fold metallo-hydrolase n=1 Tax=Micromonospora parastrephiae TaxID=2806101 RepID=A0ABS1XR32_9ACTN|nr:MBL fold metallo-hydrolase [Micromonospora parastrephiae]MBM0231726.1 MBL fold metallo-hydrolase [Micromonospora parastrephiae]
MSRGGTPETVEISEGVFVHVQPDGSWFLNNPAFLTCRRGVISIDTCATERRTRAYLAAIAAVTREPVRTLVNTHHHADHTFGNHLMPGATIVGHEQTRAEVIAFGRPHNRGVWDEIEFGEFELAPPFLTYADTVTLWADDLRCEVRHVGGPAHTTNDSIVHLVDRSVLFAGDLLFKGGTPFVLMGSISGAVEVLEKVVRPLEAQTVVPGHGPVCGPEVIDETLRYLRRVQDLAREAKAAGLSPLEAALECDLGEYHDYLDAERIVGNLHRAYAELDGVPPGARIDFAAAYRDMIAYNGGKPLTCHA